MIVKIWLISQRNVNITEGLYTAGYVREPNEQDWPEQTRQINYACSLKGVSSENIRKGTEISHLLSLVAKFGVLSLFL